MFLCPALAAWILTYRERGKAGVAALLEVVHSMADPPGCALAFAGSPAAATGKTAAGSGSITGAERV